MVNLRDRLTIVLPVKIDSPDRLRNLKLNLEWLKKNVQCAAVIVAEAGATKQADMLAKEYQAVYLYHHLEADKLFNFSLLINKAVRLVDTPVVAKIDVDCFVDPDQLERAAHHLNHNNYDLIYPFDGRFINVPQTTIDSFEDGIDLGIVEKNSTLIGNTSVGGIQMFRTEAYWQYGAWNEMLEGWGHDDTEINSRFRKLGARVIQTQGPLYHLEHDRSDNQFYGPNGLAIDGNNKHICNVINSMTRDQLELLVSCWEWSKQWSRITTRET